MSRPFGRRAPRVLVAACLACAAAPSAAGAQAPPASAPAATGPDTALRKKLARAMGSAGRRSGAWVHDATDDRTLFARRDSRGRILASNTKIFTTAAVLDRLGAPATLTTSVLGGGTLDATGALDGNLYLRGGGDPTFGSPSFARRRYASGADVERLAARVAAAGVRQVRGRVLGDESLFDSLRGGPASGYRTSGYVGPLSALSYNRGLSTRGGPAALAAARLEQALRRRGVAVAGPSRAGPTPASARPLAAVDSPALSRLTQITNKRSDNFFAEMLLKGLGAEAEGRGTTAAGARAATGFASRLGVRARLADGSGLSRANVASPRQVGALLDRLRGRPEFPAFFDSLAIAGIDGTLARRMRGGPARRRCRAKTGTLSNVSALSGYCRSRGGDTLVFSVLMNGVSPSGARRLQDRMAHAMAAYTG